MTTEWRVSQPEVENIQQGKEKAEAHAKSVPEQKHRELRTAPIGMENVPHLVSESSVILSQHGAYQECF
jgi:hypothetical protein